VVSPLTSCRNRFVMKTSSKVTDRQRGRKVERACVGAGEFHRCDRSECRGELGRRDVGAARMEAGWRIRVTDSTVPPPPCDARHSARLGGGVTRLSTGPGRIYPRQEGELVDPFEDQAKALFAKHE